ncbi:hypothetical protein MRX96_000503 [Rhipicephalus microplus]
MNTIYPCKLAREVRRKPREKEEAPREPPSRQVQLFIFGHNKPEFKARQEAAPRPKPRVLGPRRNACQGEVGFKQPFMEQVMEAMRGRARA